MLKDVEALGGCGAVILGEGPGRYAAVDWQGLAAAAGFLSRGREAFGIDYEILWHFTKSELPLLIEKIKGIRDASAD